MHLLKIKVFRNLLEILHLKYYPEKTAVSQTQNVFKTYD